MVWLRLSHPSFPFEACYLVFCRGSLWAALPDKPINGYKPFQAFPGSLVTVLTERKDNPGFGGWQNRSWSTCWLGKCSATHRPGAVFSKITGGDLGWKGIASQNYLYQRGLRSWCSYCIYLPLNSHHWQSKPFGIESRGATKALCPATFSVLSLPCTVLSILHSPHLSHTEFLAIF